MAAAALQQAQYFFLSQANASHGEGCCLNIFWAFGSYHLNLSMREAADKGSITQGLSAQKSSINLDTHVAV